MARTAKKRLTIDELLNESNYLLTVAPFQVPQNWSWTTLRRITTHQSGNSKLIKGKLASKMAQGLYPGYSASGQDVFCPDYEHEGEAVIVSAVGARCGKAFYTNGKWNAIANTHIVYPTDAINGKYLYYLLNNEEWWVKSGSAQPFVVVNESLERPFPLPPLDEQQRIVDRIECLLVKLDEAKEKAQAVIDGFEDRKAAILHKAFLGELTSIDNADSVDYVLSEIRAWAASFPSKDIKAIEKEQEKASIVCLSDRRKWIKCTVGAIGRVTNGSTPSRKSIDYWNGNIPWVSSGEVRNNTIYVTRECITRKGFENSSVKLLPKGTVLIAMIGEGKTRGQSAILEIEATINQNVAAVVLDHGLIEPAFLWFWFQMNYTKNREKGSGSGPQALNCQRVRELEFICPSIREQREIVALLRSMIQKEEQVKETAEQVIEQIDTMKKSILAHAFRGELGTNDPNDESAVELLKRVLGEEESTEPRQKQSRKKISIPKEISAFLQNDLEKKIVSLYYQKEVMVLTIKEIASVSSKTFDVLDCLKSLQDKKIIIKLENGNYKLVG